MNRGFDIRAYKKALRTRYRGLRKSLPHNDKLELDRCIIDNICNLEEYIKCRLLLTYVSTAEEIDTKPLITRALSDGKAVGVPYCIDGTRNMDFYIIQSLDQLAPRTFGVLEPIPELCEKVKRFDEGLCILPGVSFDQYGYRLGYGGGYYDRFLAHIYKGTTAGVCYDMCTRGFLTHGRFDVPCNIIVTETGARKAESRNNHDYEPAGQRHRILHSRKNKARP